MNDKGNSSIHELIGALECLGGNIYGIDPERNERNGGYKIDFYWNGIDKAVNMAHMFSQKFQNINAGMSESWDNVADVLNKISMKLHDEVDEFANQILAFADQTVANEETAKQAVDQVVSVGEDVLSELGIE